MPRNATKLSDQSREHIESALREVLSDRCTVPGAAQYEVLRTVWNKAVSRRPAYIALCESPEEVSAVIQIARRHDLSVSVRGGGHDWTGRALCDGVVIDLTHMQDVFVDPKARVVTVAGGAPAKKVVSAAAEHNLLAVVGGCGSVGMAGLTLGGGYGPLNGLYGLAADNLLSAQVVLSDGRIVEASPEVEPELFWALRGGGGNFGVVTSLQIVLHEMHQLLAGPIIFGLDDAVDVLEKYAAFVVNVPDELSVPVSMNTGVDGEPSLLMLPLWNGDLERGEQLLGALRSMGTPKFTQVGPMSYSDLLAIFDGAVDALADCHWAARTRSLSAPMSPGAIKVLARAAAERTSPFSMINWHHYHGASTRAAQDVNAFGLRQEHFMVEIFAGWKPGDQHEQRHREWADKLWHDLAPFSLVPSYPPFLESSDRERARTAYGANGERLRSLKSRFDPTDLFRSSIPLPR